MREIDVVIIGAGPAGLSAGLYASRAKLSTIILEHNARGGQIVITDEVANYPGSIEDATGPTLVKRMVDQAKAFGAEIVKDKVISIDLSGRTKIVKGVDNEYHAKAVIIANGGKSRPIDCPGEKKLIGKGVSYCATCDADFFEDMEVFVIGGGDSAVEEALYLTKFARKVTIVHRRNELRAAKSLCDHAFDNAKIEFLWDTVVEEIKGDGIVESIVFKNVKTNEVHEFFADEEDGTFGVFVFIGFNPVSELYKGAIDMDESGYIVTDDNMNTNIDGVYAAGDIRVKSLRQVVTAAADGAIAAVQAGKYIDECQNEKVKVR